MNFATIVKRAPAAVDAPNLVDYARTYQTFSWDAARGLLSGLPDGRGLNIGYEAVDRHIAEKRGDRVALRWLDKRGGRVDVTYAELAARSSQFANALAALGVAPGDLVCSLLGRVPALFVAALGTLKHRAVFSPLFSAFGPEPIRTRMNLGGARVLVTSAQLYARKIAPIRAALTSLKTVIVIDDPAPDGVLRWEDFLTGVSSDYTIGATSSDTPALLHFTSGTTGVPKGALHVHEAVVMHHVTGRLALDLRPDDIFWCTADPGWVTGTSYGIIAPLTNGVTLVLDEAEFDVERWYDILAQQRVNVFYTAPTAIRRLMRAGVEPARTRDLSALRFLASVGEPLNPEGVIFGQQAFGIPFHDNWWQTETGGIAIANFASMDVKPGSMGKPMPGIEAHVVQRAADGSVTKLADEQVGELALRRGWPSMFRAYYRDPERYQKAFADDLYLSGDLVRRDRDGYFWFVGRSDDVIKTAGHLVGPFEVESALMEHSAVAEAAVIGKPDAVAGEILKAFVVLRPTNPRCGTSPSELLAFARKRLGAAIAPREIAVVDGLPRTRSGKILRRLLRARELGLPEGDLSTLEADS